jgi:hypothetical protein
MAQDYSRLVDLFVKPDLRDEIKFLKREQTYDQFLRNLIIQFVEDKQNSEGKFLQIKENTLPKKGVTRQ